MPDLRNLCKLYGALVIDGQRYSHILDPRTRRPLSTPRQVTVIAPTGLIADALDTAICVTG